MQCPVCHHSETNVIDSRISRDGQEIRRRRECDKCKDRFTTYERVAQVFPWVIKKDDRREEFNRDKIMAGLLRAVEKRPVSIHQVEALLQEVVQAIVGMNEKEVTSHLIGNEVMKRLKDLDEVAYVRFASVYRQFKDTHDFLDELRSMLGPAKKQPLKAKRLPQKQNSLSFPEL